MDAYDHIQEESLRTSGEGGEKPTTSAEETAGNLSTDLQDAYKSFTASPWGARLGGFLGSVRKQGESVYQGARHEASIASEEAMKGFTDLKTSIVSRARSMSLTDRASPTSPGKGKEEDAEAEKEGTSKEAPQDPATDSEGFVARFRAEAEKRLKDIQKAEDAADEALLKFGTNIRNFLRDAVTVSAPSEGDSSDPTGTGKVLFESKDAEGKRVIHTTRFDAQLHVIHCSLDSFLKDPASPEYAKWKEGFDVEKKTEDIAANLQKYEELRRAMEKLVPEKVEYNLFWTRYYFLRMVIESEEKRRKEMLKGATSGTEEEVGWDEDSDEEPSTPQPKASAGASSQDIHPEPLSSSAATLEPLEPRKSQDQHSQDGSDASYDLVSGATSRAPGSPRDDKESGKKAGTSEAVKEESDEEDWE